MTVSIEQQFISETITKGIRDIFEAQKEIAQSRIYSRESTKPRSGHLMNALSIQKYTLNPDGNGFQNRVVLPLYIRFLDMKKRGNYMIYNRQVYGILYHEVLFNIKYRYSSYVEEQIKNQLIKSL